MRWPTPRYYSHRRWSASREFDETRVVTLQALVPSVAITIGAA